MSKIIFLNSHPIQYFAPLYQKMAAEGLPIEAWYCSDESIQGRVDEGFGVKVKWDIPLLQGYTYRFFKNRSWKPSIYKGFWGLYNPGLIASLFKEPKGIVIIHGWGYLTNWLSIISARLAGHKVCLRGESPLNQELTKGKLNLLIKKAILKSFLFNFIHYFLYIGKENQAFYRFYGVKEDQLLFAPYCVDNQRFQKAYKDLAPQKNELRRQLELPEDAFIILYSGKYIAKKRPMDLLEAFRNIDHPKKALVMVGEGELRSSMEKFIASHQLKDVYLTGFINQLQIEKYYAIADVFVLCSGVGETWGLVVNEAMNFGLPIIVSETAGCSADLVIPKENGYPFPTGNTVLLSQYLGQLIQNQAQAEEMGGLSLERINQYSYDQIIETVLKLVQKTSEK